MWPSVVAVSDLLIGDRETFSAIRRGIFQAAFVQNPLSEKGKSRQATPWHGV
jgi:hypothetical protein